MARYWLLKSDPETFGLAELAASPGRTAMWDGVRNYQARNYLRDEVREGDGVLLYHSGSRPPAVVATARVVREAYPDPTQFDSASAGHDPRSRRDEPRWFAVDIRLEEPFERPVTLPSIRARGDLAEMVLVRSPRLSVQPVSETEWNIVTSLGRP